MQKDVRVTINPCETNSTLLEIESKIPIPTWFIGYVEIVKAMGTNCVFRWQGFVAFSDRVVQYAPQESQLTEIVRHQVCHWKRIVFTFGVPPYTPHEHTTRTRDLLLHWNFDRSRSNDCQTRHRSRIVRSPGYAWGAVIWGNDRSSRKWDNIGDGVLLLELSYHSYPSRIENPGLPVCTDSPQRRTVELCFRPFWKSGKWLKIQSKAPSAPFMGTTGDLLFNPSFPIPNMKAPTAWFLPLTTFIAHDWKTKNK